MVTEEAAGQSVRVDLYRCGCKHCDVAEGELTRLSKDYGAKLTIKRVENEPYMHAYAGWSTPMVELNGRHVSRYTLSMAKWEEAIRQGTASLKFTLGGR